MSKSVGIVRSLDRLGRIVVPIELRRSMEMDIGNSIEFFIDVESKRMMMRSYRTRECLFCQAMDDLTYFHERFVCSECLHELLDGNLTKAAKET